MPLGAVAKGSGGWEQGPYRLALALLNKADGPYGRVAGAQPQWQYTLALCTASGTLLG